MFVFWFLFQDYRYRFTIQSSVNQHFTNINVKKWVGITCDLVLKRDDFYDTRGKFFSGFYETTASGLEI